MYILERLFLISSLTIIFISVWFIPKEKRAQASFIFFTTQFFTWIMGLTVVELNWLEYPVREFYKANGTSFSFEYFSLPVITIFFILYYPSNKPYIIRLIYNLSFSLSITVIEHFIEKYTLVIKYLSWKWYWTSISVLIVFHLVMFIYKWFFKLNGSKDSLD
ncbi:hypothetical protein Sgly_2005 [Syntrophobotulus glycolicus DSM 8271]|uniref:Uncharacterized protein n=1 Tax=Syntrophobotulus glycolicus (strain DSM 8271 / FlGlyR) TaxID=645991 RepID=F0T1F8_SYNGF|nr:CBO0543 family protein [Syntrophobotulus glycolicus]ADY56299.1 hypothetical protein Sgly_2005 [Syntrophobotulus glycolicus DSM 8271]